MLEFGIIRHGRAAHPFRTKKGAPMEAQMLQRIANALERIARALENK